MYNLGDLLYRGGDKVAIIHENTHYTYNDIFSMANKFANGLKAYGIIKGDRVSIVAENSANYIAAYLGILKIGAVAVLVSTKISKDFKTFIENDSDIKLELNDNNFDYYSSDMIDHTSIQMNETDPALILYSSGSTGMPKGVIISHAHLWIIKEKSKSPLLQKLRYFIAAPFYHMNGLSNIETALSGGATVILMSKFEAGKALNLICTHKVNYISSVPSMIALMLKEPTNLDLSFVKRISMASAPVSINLYNSIKEKFPNANISISYGSTETGPGLFGRHPTLATPDMSVGYPIDGIEYRLVEGVLQVKSPSMLLKYNNLHTNFTEDGFFVTKDIFRVDENGFYFFVGRTDDMFVCGGDNVYPRQIEYILEGHNYVKDSAVIGLDDDIKGMKPYAFVTTSSVISEESLIEYCFTKLPPNICPRKIWIIEKMPLTDVQKIDKTMLKQIAHEYIR